MAPNQGPIRPNRAVQSESTLGRSPCLNCKCILSLSLSLSLSLHLHLFSILAHKIAQNHSFTSNPESGSKQQTKTTRTILLLISKEHTVGEFEERTQSAIELSFEDDSAGGQQSSIFCKQPDLSNI